jgi:ribosomal protein S18 acetylase RimI-like enzyme
VKNSSALEFRQVVPGFDTVLGDFFEALQGNGDFRLFHPHELSRQEARRLCAYKGKDLYYIGVEANRVLCYGMLRGWDEGYKVPSLGIAIHPELRGSGLASAFMHFLHAAAKLAGAKQVRLKVYKHNQIAKNLYGRLGYRYQEASPTELLGILEL